MPDFRFELMHVLVRYSKPDPVLTKFRKHIDQYERRLTLQVSTALEGPISYRSDWRPSQVGMCGLGEPAGAVHASERVLRNFKIT
jgi:hypothetical protein